MGVTLHTPKTYRLHLERLSQALKRQIGPARPRIPSRQKQDDIVRTSEPFRSLQGIQR